ncbi:MAG: glycosyltransferase, partial [Candidatus Limnocylindria bacterium]
MNASPAATLELSVLIAARASGERLERCLESLARQSAVTGGYEVVVIVRGGSPTPGVDHSASKLPFAFRVLRLPPGTGDPWRDGALAASGRIVLLLFDDMTADRELIAEHQRLHRERTGVVGHGRVIVDVSDPAGALARSAAAMRADRRSRLAGGDLTPAECRDGNVSVERSRLLSHEGSGARTADEACMDHAYRLRAGGAQLVFLPRAVASERRARSSRSAVIREAEEEGAADARTMRRHPEALADLR